MKGGWIYLPLFLLYRIMETKEIIEEIKFLFALKGNENYGENVTQQEHAIQCYQLAVSAKADLNLRVAAFLHDIGHLKYQDEEGREKDMKHENWGATLVKRWGFGEEVASLILTHVWAKRYLVSCEPYYINRLSAASLRSFQLQGGLMSDEEVEAARNHPYFQKALMLRRWDDTGKQIDIESEIPESVWADLAECLMVNRSFD